MAKYTNELMLDDLTDAEIKDIAKIVDETVGALVKWADKNNIDRDSGVRYFADMLSTMCEVATFRNFHKENNNE